jgi:hypothetical protein
MDSFKRLVTDHTPYTIHKIDGDGNCFFRAVVRHTYPNITRAWEDALSLGLRKRLNTVQLRSYREMPLFSRSRPPCSPLHVCVLSHKQQHQQGSEREMQAHGKGAEYQFHGFVIENVNDSLTMAKAGVWADHIQVQKLSQKLQRPLELFTFDDVALRMDRQGKYVPFPLSRFASFRFVLFRVAHVHVLTCQVASRQGLHDRHRVRRASHLLVLHAVAWPLRSHLAASGTRHYMMKMVMMMIVKTD